MNVGYCTHHISYIQKFLSVKISFIYAFSKIMFSENRLLLISLPTYKVPLYIFWNFNFRKGHGIFESFEINSIENFWLYGRSSDVPEFFGYNTFLQKDPPNRKQRSCKRCEVNQRQSYKRLKHLISRKAKKTKLFIQQAMSRTLSDGFLFHFT